MLRPGCDQLEWAGYNRMPAPGTGRLNVKLCARSRADSILRPLEPRLPGSIEPLMAIRTILEFPDPRLRTRAQPVTRFDTELHRVVDDMLETMYAAPGIGLAATQIDVHQRLIVIDISADRNDALVLINPEILSREGEIATEEGCLSVPGYFEEVKRASKIRVRAQDRDGNAFEKDCEEILAVCVQHEMDHLDGRLFVDYLSGLKRERIRKKLEKERKERTARSAAEAGRERRRAL
jgi:peptide deformylase